MKGLSNFVAILITTSILVLASSIFMLNASHIMQALKPDRHVHVYLECSRILNASIFICSLKSNAKYCGNVSIITINGTITISKCFNSVNPYILVLTSRPIAIEFKNHYKLIKVS